MTTSNRSSDPARSVRVGEYIIRGPSCLLASSGGGSSSSSNNNNNNNNEKDEEEFDDGGVLDCNDNSNKRSRKKPSYVGLSCAVNGYSSYARYQSPLRKTSPSQIHVDSEPQTLDVANCNSQAMRNNNNNGHVETSPPIRGQVMAEDSSDAAATAAGRYFSSKKFFSPPPSGPAGDGRNCLREGSPGSDCSGASSTASSGSCGGGSGSGLVQKQIERLYGGRVLPVRVTSPEPKNPKDLSFSSSNNSSSRGPLEFKPLKVPAVFRLLRPEFREQLKNNSCQVHIPTENSNGTATYRVTTSNYERRARNVAAPDANERVIPIVKSCERVIPIVVEKPALPAKPGAKKAPPPTPHIVKSPALVANCLNGAKARKEEQQEEEEEEEKIPPAVDLDEEEQEGMDEVDFSQHPIGGIRERALLCPIQEEDGESTASTNSLIAAGSHRNGVSKNGKCCPPAAEVAAVAPVQDGHYFIKILENETFKFEEQICDFEEDLSASDSSIPDDVRDSILAAVGKGKLLMSQKLVQFRGLCDKNINSNHAEDPFVPTSEDLAGFWDMVYIQVEHIHSLFAELTTLRKNGWVQPNAATNGSSANGSIAKSSPVKKRVHKAAAAKDGSDAQSKKKSEANKARDAARRKMIEERRRMMKSQNNNVPKGDVEVFVAVK